MSGVLSSPNYPRDYSSYADCLWVIKVIHYLNYYAYLASIKKDNCSEKHYFVEKTNQPCCYGSLTWSGTSWIENHTYNGRLSNRGWCYLLLWLAGSVPWRATHRGCSVSNSLFLYDKYTLCFKWRDIMVDVLHSRFCGEDRGAANRPPRTIEYPGNTLLIKFHADDSNEFSGFRARYIIHS